MSQPIKPLVWQGSKQSLLPHLLPILLAGKKPDTFVEVFAGSAVVTLALPKRTGVVEVINGFNGDLINFYRCMIHHAPEMKRLMRWQINSRTLFIQTRDHQTHRTDLQRACDFWFLNHVSFGGDGTSFGVSRKAGGGGAAYRWQHGLKTLRSASRRMSGVAVENLDWRRCLKTYDHNGAQFFIDPPYVGTIQSAYESFSLAEMTELRDACLALKGRFLLTVGDTPEMRRLFKTGFTQKSVSRARGINNAAGKAYAELILTRR